MKKKTAAYLAIGIVGIALALAAKFLLQGFLSNVQSGAMVGVGAGLFGYGMGKGCVALWGEKHPDPVPELRGGVAAAVYNDLNAHVVLQKVSSCFQHKVIIF